MKKNALKNTISMKVSIRNETDFFPFKNTDDENWCSLKTPWQCFLTMFLENSTYSIFILTAECSIPIFCDKPINRCIAMSLNKNLWFFLLLTLCTNFIVFAKEPEIFIIKYVYLMGLLIWLAIKLNQIGYSNLTGLFSRLLIKYQRVQIDWLSNR